VEQRAVRAIEKREQRAVDKWPLNGEREREREREELEQFWLDAFLVVGIILNNLLRAHINDNSFLL